MFLLKKLLSILLIPPGLPLVVLFLGLAVMARRPRWGRALVWLGGLATWLFSSYWFVSLLLAPLEDMHPVSMAEARNGQAIVILAGGRLRNAPEYGGETVNRLTLERARYGARLARGTGLPVLVTGGAPMEGTPEAQLLKAVLEQDFGVPVRWTEDQSLDTRENARKTAALLRPLGVSKVVLVSHAAHLKRAQAEFRAAGLEPILAPTAFLGRAGNSEISLTIGDVLPTPSAAYAGWYACHEWLGILAQRLAGIK